MSQRIPLIAVLDDEQQFRLALSRLLKAHRYEVASFATGQELIAGRARQRFDCLLLDLGMAGMSGLDVLTEWHRHPLAPPVIVITGSDDPDILRQAVDLQAFECHLKPIVALNLLGAIARACGRRGQPSARRST
jgi:DNA-binding NtrC family response regulator